MSEERKVENFQTKDEVKSFKQEEALNQNVPSISQITEIKENIHSSVETSTSDDILKSSKKHARETFDSNITLSGTTVRQSDESLGDSHCGLELDSVVAGSEIKISFDDLPEINLINSRRGLNFAFDELNLIERPSSHIHDSDSGLGSSNEVDVEPYICNFTADLSPSFEISCIDHFIEEPTVPIFLENIEQSKITCDPSNLPKSKLTLKESKTKMYRHTKEFLRHYHLYYSPYVDFVLLELFPIIGIKLFHSVCFWRIISNVWNVNERFTDEYSTANERYSKSPEKKTFDEREQNKSDILRKFEDAYERQEWNDFNFSYHPLLFHQDTTICKLRGVMVENVFHFVKENIEPSVNKAYFGFCLKRKQTVLVVLIDNVFFDQKKTTTYRGLPILYKQWTEITEESVNTCTRSRKYEVNTDTLEYKDDIHVNMRECIKEHSPQLMKSHSNIEIICASTYRSIDSGKIIRKENCILIYCIKKNVIPLGEMIFEERIGEFKIDVREGFFYLYPGIGHKNLETFIAPTDRHPELKIGAEISRKDGTVKGTLGGFVKIGDHGQLGFITCAHVLHDIPERMVKNYEKIVQPSYGLLETNDICGVLIKSVHPRGSDKTTVDASLVQVESSRKPSRISFTGLRKDQLRQLGFSPNEIYSGEILEKAENNAPCFKSGATTNFTIGKLEGRSLSAKYIVDFRDPSQDAVFYDQYVVSSTSIIPFASSGDSGAFVFQCIENSGKKSYACIGMVVGGTSDSKVVVTPIREVLNALDLQDTMKLCTFEDEKMETNETDEKSMCCIS